ncbi:SPOR domain-containing protein [Polaribacter sp.]|uniref:SPOR domain-containing protein n=1 Tax=Polaribacter sp. TaxID=1920175 RepID=UPI0040480BCC
MKYSYSYWFFGLFLILGLETITAQNSTNMSPQVKALIAKKRAFNKDIGFGYRVQIFYGEESEARNAQSKFSSTYPDVFTKLTYDQPYWKVQVGNYKTKLEADKALLNFSEKFSGLIVISLLR